MSHVVIKARCTQCKSPISLGEEEHRRLRSALEITVFCHSCLQKTTISALASPSQRSRQVPAIDPSTITPPTKSGIPPFQAISSGSKNTGGKPNETVTGVTVPFAMKHGDGRATEEATLLSSEKPRGWLSRQSRLVQVLLLAVTLLVCAVIALLILAFIPKPLPEEEGDAVEVISSVEPIKPGNGPVPGP
jgi:hypothetical protein